MCPLFVAVAVPAETQPAKLAKPKRRPRFWVGPVMAGSCFALGFGVTQRIVAMQGGESAPSSQAFNPKPFPGVGLQSLRDRFDGASKPLKADVAAWEAELAKTRPPKPQKLTWPRRRLNVLLQRPVASSSRPQPVGHRLWSLRRFSLRRSSPWMRPRLFLHRSCPRRWCQRNRCQRNRCRRRRMLLRSKSPRLSCFHSLRSLRPCVLLRPWHQSHLHLLHWT